MTFFRKVWWTFKWVLRRCDPGKVEDLCQISDGSWIKQELYAVSWIIIMPDAYILRFDVENKSPDYWAVFVGYIFIYINIVWLSLRSPNIFTRQTPFQLIYLPPFLSSWIGRRLQNLNLHRFWLVIDTQQVSWKWHRGGIRRQQLEFTGICDTSKNTRGSTVSVSNVARFGMKVAISCKFSWIDDIFRWSVFVSTWNHRNENGKSQSRICFSHEFFGFLSADKRFLYRVYIQSSPNKLKAKQISQPESPSRAPTSNCRESVFPSERAHNATATRKASCKKKTSRRYGWTGSHFLMFGHLEAVQTKVLLCFSGIRNSFLPQRWFPSKILQVICHVGPLH